jgi:hypothetical protein
MVASATGFRDRVGVLRAEGWTSGDALRFPDVTGEGCHLRRHR